jgi:thioredoxin reductase (NADPH)
MYDIVIVGNGPAALSCAITARMRGLNTLFAGPLHNAGWLARAERIDNYPGLPEVSGAALLAAFKAQALALGAQERHGLVRQIIPNDGGFMVLIESDVVETRTVVLAMGAARPQLLSGEEELVGMGVSYCATCDGMLYRGKRIAALSATAEGAEETHFLASVAAGVDYYSLKSHDTGAMPANVTVSHEQPASLQRVPEGIRLTTRQGEHTYDGVFIFRSAVALGMLLAELETEGSFIPVDRGMRTNVPGVFAAGDVTGKPLQVAKAVGEGNIAALSAADSIGRRG